MSNGDTCEEPRCALEHNPQETPCMFFDAAPSRAPSEPPAHLVHLRGCDKPADHEGRCRAPSEEPR